MEVCDGWLEVVMGGSCGGWKWCWVEVVVGGSK